MRELPIRRLSRLGNEGLLSSSLAVIELGRGRYEWGVVALLLLSRCAGDWVGENAIRRPARTRHYMSIRAIATSLDAPYASIQRHVGGLLAEGIVVATEKGYAISNDPAVAPIIITFLIGEHDRFIRLVEDFAPDLDTETPPVARHPGLLAATVAAALDLWLVPYEVAREPVTEWTGKLVWIVIVVANVRHITTDDALSRAYASEPTPDDLRKPINVGRIAAITGLSYGTTYRHCRKLADGNVIKYDRGGWLLVSRQLANREIEDGVKALLAYYVKRIHDLESYGLNIKDVGSFYLKQRPDYVPLGLL